MEALAGPAVKVAQQASSPALPPPPWAAPTCASRAASSASTLPWVAPASSCFHRAKATIVSKHCRCPGQCRSAGDARHRHTCAAGWVACISSSCRDTGQYCFLALKKRRQAPPRARQRPARASHLQLRLQGGQVEVNVVALAHGARLLRPETSEDGSEHAHRHWFRARGQPAAAALTCAVALTICAEATPVERPGRLTGIYAAVECGAEAGVGTTMSSAACGSAGHALL